MTDTGIGLPHCADCDRVVLTGSGYCRECTECDRLFCLCAACQADRVAASVEHLCARCAARQFATLVRPT